MSRVLCLLCLSQMPLPDADGALYLQVPTGGGRGGGGQPKAQRATDTRVSVSALRAGCCTACHTALCVNSHWSVS